jgi:hypothetical protein
MPIVTPVPPISVPPTGPVNAASTNATPAVQGTSFASLPTGVNPGTLGSGTGVMGGSGTGVGVVGISNGGDAINGTSSSPQHAGVSANNNGGGFGLWAKAIGTQPGTGGVAGFFDTDGNNAIQAVSTSAKFDTILAQSSAPQSAAVSASNSNGGYGVWARAETSVSSPANPPVAGFFRSDGGYAIQAIGNSPGYDAVNVKTSSALHAAVSASNTNSNSINAYGVWASSASGPAIYAISPFRAGQFNGQVLVTGNHDVIGNCTVTGNHDVTGNGTVNGNCHVAGTHTVDGDIILTNSDCAEDFEVVGSAPIEPGTVMVLTDSGDLQACQEPYDRKVAGVISGAGDYKPGLILGRKDSSPKRMPLGLAGKVYCKVDAHYAPVQVGDLLTTSPTEGHAMRASDPAKAFGAVIGKALRPLHSGQALVPILIALQ